MSRDAYFFESYVSGSQIGQDITASGGQRRGNYIEEGGEGASSKGKRRMVPNIRMTKHSSWDSRCSVWGRMLSLRANGRRGRREVRKRMSESESETGLRVVHIWLGDLRYSTRRDVRSGKPDP